MNLVQLQKLILIIFLTSSDHFICFLTAIGMGDFADRFFSTRNTFVSKKIMFQTIDNGNGAITKRSKRLWLARADSSAKNINAVTSRVFQGLVDLISVRPQASATVDNTRSA